MSFVPTFAQRYGTVKVAMYWNTPDVRGFIRVRAGKRGTLSPHQSHRAMSGAPKANPGAIGLRLKARRRFFASHAADEIVGPHTDGAKMMTQYKEDRPFAIAYTIGSTEVRQFFETFDELKALKGPCGPRTVVAGPMAKSMASARSSYRNRGPHAPRIFHPASDRRQ